ncbi:MAG TPA: RluA family pseudouridine synthase [Ruminococcaceae bacterium]|nr:RluA family pseudouridine synthase [Oscillospiraceae bacterium]
MKSFDIKANDAGQRLDKFIRKGVPNLPQSLMYKYIRKKRIKVNNKRAEISTVLQVGDKVDMYINDEFFVKPETRYDFTGAPSRLDILYEDDNIMLLDKKAGLLCHPDDREYVDTLITRIKKYLYEKGEYKPDEENSFTPALVNRIDRNTGGIVIAAKNAESLRIMNAQMKERTNLKKFYLCVCHGIMERDSGLLEGYLLKDEKKNTVKILKQPCDGAKEIRTKYKVLGRDYDKQLSLVEVELMTGRTHQIRAHFASIGHPLLGDGKYGTNKLNKEFGYRKQCLYSYKLVFMFDESAGILSYLNSREFEVKDVWFKREFENGTL